MTGSLVKVDTGSLISRRSKARSPRCLAPYRKSLGSLLTVTVHDACNFDHILSSALSSDAIHLIGTEFLNHVSVFSAF